MKRRKLLKSLATAPLLASPQIFAQERGVEGSVELPAVGGATTVAGMNFVYRQVGPAGSEGATIVELIVAPGAGAPPHKHAQQESFYILEGTFEVTIDGLIQRLKQGAFVKIEGNMVHSFKNVGEGLAKTLTISTPHGLADLFFAAGTPIDNPFEEVPPKTEEDIAKLIRLAPKYGVTILPKPE